MSTADTTSSARPAAVNISGVVILAAGLLLGQPSARAQTGSYSDGRVAETQSAPPIDLRQVPRDACVWGNAIYSNGAMMTKSDLFTTYFQCERGTWAVVSPGDAIFRRRAAANPDGFAPARP